MSTIRACARLEKIRAPAAAGHVRSAPPYWIGAFRVGLRDPETDRFRAFDLAAHTDGLWLTHEKHFAIVTCQVCTSEFLAANGSTAGASGECPFCKLVQRYGTDQRLQSSFPARPLVDPASIQLGMLALLRGM